MNKIYDVSKYPWILHVCLDISNIVSSNAIGHIALKVWEKPIFLIIQLKTEHNVGTIIDTIFLIGQKSVGQLVSTLETT
jgi:hypothetical protein